MAKYWADTGFPVNMWVRLDVLDLENPNKSKITLVNDENSASDIADEIISFVRKISMYPLHTFNTKNEKTVLKLNGYQMKIVDELLKDARPLLSLVLEDFASGTEFSIKFDARQLLLPLNEFEERNLLKFLAGDPSITVERKDE